MSFSSCEIHEFFDAETSREPAVASAWNKEWCRRFRSGRREGHDIKPLPREVSCLRCRRELGTPAALPPHLYYCKGTK